MYHRPQLTTKGGVLCAALLLYARAASALQVSTGVEPAAHFAQVALRGGAGYYLGMGDDAPGAVSEYEPAHTLKSGRMVHNCLPLPHSNIAEKASPSAWTGL